MKKGPPLGTRRHRATPFEIEERRTRVVHLRHAGLSEPEIGRRLGVSAATVSRDLQTVREDWSRRFGSNYDAAREVGEGVSLFGLLEATAIRELLRLESETKRSTGAMMQCCWVARSARQARIDLLVSAGVIGAEQETTPTRTDAASIRSYLRAEGLIDHPPVDSQTDSSNDERLEKWLAGELNEEDDLDEVADA